MPVEIAGTTVYTLEEIAEKLDVPVATLRTYVDERRPRATRVGRTFRVTSEALRDFLDPGRARELAEPGPGEEDPFLRVIGIGVDGGLTRHIDQGLYA
ncbi:MAG: helix-turn-helix domain-containing protein [Candidatus Latescibacterota bacterium]